MATIQRLFPGVSVIALLLSLSPNPAFADDAIVIDSDATASDITTASNTAENEADVTTQDGGSSQSADVHSDAGTIVAAGANASAGNIIRVLRTCNVQHGACFQFDGPDGAPPVVVIGGNPDWTPAPCTPFAELWNQWMSNGVPCPSGSGKDIEIPENANWLVRYYNENPDKKVVMRIESDLHRAIRKAKQYLSNTQKECNGKKGTGRFVCNSRYLRLLSLR